ncbi:hypothetical protein COY95_05315, partial [Candidatus Woesearchaeota archaeon CG_4_10_14_0_8_um_filter_47_5]
FMRQCEYVEHNVDYQIAYLLGESLIRPLVESGTITLVGMVFDIHDVYKGGRAHLLLTNINGETSLEKLKKHSLLSLVADEQKEKRVQRLR